MLPAVLFTVAMVVFPLLFGLWIAFSDWNLSGATGRRFNGFANIVQMWHDPFYWNALRQHALVRAGDRSSSTRIAFGLALLLNADIRGRKFWRVVFLMPLMLSPVAVSWMVGKSMHGVSLRADRALRPLARLGEPGLLRHDPGSPGSTIMMMDAWTFIPFMMIMLLAGLQACDARSWRRPGSMAPRAGRASGRSSFR